MDAEHIEIIYMCVPKMNISLMRVPELCAT